MLNYSTACTLHSSWCYNEKQRWTEKSSIKSIFWKRFSREGKGGGNLRFLTELVPANSTEQPPTSDIWTQRNLRTRAVHVPQISVHVFLNEFHSQTPASYTHKVNSWCEIQIRLRLCPPYGSSPRLVKWLRLKLILWLHLKILRWIQFLFAPFSLHKTHFT